MEEIKEQKKIESIDDLCEVLKETLIELRAGKIGIREANATANIAGKIIKAVDLQIQYNAWMGLKEIGLLKLKGHD